MNLRTFCKIGICVVFSTLSAGCKQKNAERGGEKYEVVEAGRSSVFGPFEVTLNGARTADYYTLGRYHNEAAGTGNKFIILNLTYANVGDNAQTIHADGIFAAMDNKVVLFNESRVLTDFQHTVNPGVKETFELAYKVPERLTGKAFFAPDGNEKYIAFDVSALTIKYN